MSDPSDFDTLYLEWLEIPADRLPPNHYALLGLDDFEPDVERIEEAAKARSAYLYQIASGPQRKIVQEVLGKVAIARRTLLDEGSRTEYEAALRQPASASPEDAAEDQRTDQVASGDPAGVTPPGESAASNENAASSSRSAPAESRPRRKSGDWKYHAISAGVLLAIVGGIFLYNRGGGGRRAATVATPEKSADPAPAKSRPKRTAKATAGKQAPPTRPSNAPRRSPVVAKRSTGSGLGAAMSGKFGDVLSDIEKQASGEAASEGGAKLPGEEVNEPVPAAVLPPDAGAVAPLGTLVVGKSKNSVSADQLPGDLVAVEAFPADLSTRFDCAQGDDWYTVNDGQLQVKRVSGKNWFQLVDREFRLKPGGVIQVSTSLTSKMNSDIRLAVRVAGIQIGIRPSGKQQVEVFARDRGAEAKIQSLHKLKTSAQRLTLTVQRDAKNSKRLIWFLKAGEKRSTGSIDVEGLGAESPLALIVAASKKESKRPFRVGGLMTSAAN